jgi:hypothetical protein
MGPGVRFAWGPLAIDAKPSAPHITGPITGRLRVSSQVLPGSLARLPSPGSQYAAIRSDRAQGFLPH